MARQNEAGKGQLSVDSHLVSLFQIQPPPLNPGPYSHTLFFGPLTTDLSLISPVALSHLPSNSLVTWAKRITWGMGAGGGVQDTGGGNTIECVGSGRFRAF